MKDLPDSVEPCLYQGYGFIKQVMLTVESAYIPRRQQIFPNAQRCRDLIQIAHLLLQRGANVNAQGGLMGNALQDAIFCNKPRMVRLLLALSAEINLPGRWENALAAAKALGHDDILEILLQSANQPK